MTDNIVSFRKPSPKLYTPRPLRPVIIEQDFVGSDDPTPFFRLTEDQFDARVSATLKVCVCVLAVIVVVLAVVLAS